MKFVILSIIMLMNFFKKTETSVINYCKYSLTSLYPVHCTDLDNNNNNNNL